MRSAIDLPPSSAKAEQAQSADAPESFLSAQGRDELRRARSCSGHAADHGDSANLSCELKPRVASMQEIAFNGKQYRIEGEQVWAHLETASVHRCMEWGKRKGHWRALPKHSPLRRYLVKIARGEKAEVPRLR
jgi:hypothetical protein